MFGCTTEGRFRRHRTGREGSALVGVLVVFVGVAGLVAASVTLSTVEVEESRDSVDKVRARFISEAGIESGIAQLSNAAALSSSLDPLEGIRSLFAAGDSITPFLAEPLLSGNSQVGAYTVTMDLVSVSDTQATVDIVATGYLPAAPVPGGRPVDDWSSTAIRLQYELAPSEVFDYAYFINNWGWLYGSTIYALGNVRSNGQYDSGGYAPTITGTPTYDQLDYTPASALGPASVALTGYRDDNEDGLLDGNDGGIWSGWDIANSQHVQGNGGNSPNQHDFVGQVPMPNLSDLTVYKEEAISSGGSISISGSPVVSGVAGDDPGEKGSLYLVGTAANPVVIDGPIVAEGDVIISGYVSGQGAIYAGGNIYIPDSIHYLDPPTSERPGDNGQEATEDWIADNWDKDFLGLFSAESVVVGDYTHWLWKHYVSGWMNDAMNESKEDAGEDGIPNTKAGLDGILGTADDDVLEGDGIWTVDTYSLADESMGLIPTGFSVGDAVPGSGEDIDGDGKYDDTIDYDSIKLTKSINSGNFDGNVPAGGVASYNSIASMYANHIDAVVYTNHAFAWTVFGSQDAEINGALICRNESIVYGTPTVTYNYDSRLLGGATGMASDLLPKVLKEPSILRWSQLDFDPNLSALKP